MAGYDLKKHELSYVRGEKGLGLGIAVRPAKVIEYPDGKDGEGQRVVEWFAPMRHRVFDVARVIRDDPDKLQWQDTLKRVFQMEPLTLKLYRANVMSQPGGGPSFRSESAMRRYFLTLGSKSMVR